MRRPDKTDEGETDGGDEPAADSAFPDTAESLRMMKAFAAIRNPEDRRRVIAMAEMLAPGDSAAMPKVARSH